MNESVSSGTHQIIVPGALSDFAKALRELIGAFRDVAGLVGDGAKIIQRQHAGRAVGNLDAIAFAPDGFCGPLMRIGNGNESAAEYDELERLLGDSAAEVADRLRSLRKYRETLRINCGAKICQKFDEMLDGPAGKFIIRYEIEGLVHMYNNKNTEKEHRQVQANRVLDMIASFNNELAELHDTIFPPRGAPR